MPPEMEPQASMLHVAAGRRNQRFFVLVRTSFPVVLEEVAARR